jgi:3-oxosteroid 1-dehydrogenase
MTENQKGISRRQILTGAATAGLGVVALSSCRDPSDVHSEPKWDHQADIVAVGSGLGACTAAMQAHENGDSVLIVEKAPIFGGTSAKTVGVLWIPNNFSLKEKGIEDKKEDCLEYLARYSFPEHYDPNSPSLGLSTGAYELLEAFYDNASKATDMLKSGGLKLAEWRMFHLDRSATDYLDQVPENKVPQGRTLGTMGDDGNMGGGTDMMGQLESLLRAHGTPILLEHQAVRLVMDDDERVVGLEVEHAGQTLLVKANKGVIFGSGGYVHNREMVAGHQRNHIYGSCAIPMATGDFINIAGAAGARMGNLSGAWRTQVVFEQTLKSSKLAGGVFIPPGDSMIQVNKYGLRAVNEKRNYNDRTEVHSTFDSSNAEYKNQFLFMIYDQRSAEAFADIYPLPATPKDADHVIAGDTLAALVENIEDRLQKNASASGGVKLDAAFGKNLEATMQRYNGFARAGKDDDFGRGSALYDTEWHLAFSPMRTDTQWPENDQPNAAMYPLREEGPYYAIILAAGALDTNGGPEIDASARVLNTRDEPIAGLYGTGNCIASPSRDAYWGAGCPLGLSLTFGYVAANAAHREVHEEA